MLTPFAGWVTDLVKKMKTKISVKIFLGIFAVLSLTFASSFILFSVLLPGAFEREFRNQFNDFMWEFGIAFQTATVDELPELVTRFGIENGANITVYDEAGNIAYSHASFNIDTIDTADFIISHRFGMTNTATGQSYFTYAVASLGAVRQVTNIIGGILPFALVFSLAISLFVAALYSRNLAKPIVALSDMSRKMSQIDLSNRCDINRTDEIGELGNNLNIMAGKLEAALSELQAANDKLHEDMDRERKQEQQRSDLFTAISHELKTPITILKGEIGGMIDGIGVYKDRDAYLQNAFKTTEHMEKLVHDILMVSRIEAKEIQFNFGKTDISLLVNGLCHSHEDLANSQNVAVVCYCEDGVTATADKQHMKNAISNIISNAIFHSPTGEIVNVQLVKSDGMGILTVENVGHINESDLENLFEPFYRGDKSRNRYTGGSGLGLYIVNRILKTHGFSYSISNKGDTVVFTLSFPLVY
ncbi:MAG: HAMP domain-containing histidine kinase [Defluviitaleaceae bacterium]|nr:HAMP domain-containing histidine kinase [Defluviitaleaceae bacterium]